MGFFFFKKLTFLSNSFIIIKFLLLQTLKIKIFLPLSTRKLSLINTYDFQNNLNLHSKGKIFKYTYLPNFSLFGIRFLEYLFNRKILLNMKLITTNSLVNEDVIRCDLWVLKLKAYTKLIGSGFFLKDTIYISYWSLKTHNIQIMMDWFQSTMGRISFWKLRSFIHFLEYIFKFVFWPIFSQLNIKGIKFQLKGKISVSGNSRKRIMVFNVGKTSRTTTIYRTIQLRRLIPSFTGVMGFTMWFFT